MLLAYSTRDHHIPDVVVVISHQQVCKGEVTEADTQDDAGENGMMVLESIHRTHDTYYTKLITYMYVLSLVLVLQYILYIHDSNTLYMFQP